MCVDATVRAAKDLGFLCTIIGNAYATKDLEINGEKISAGNVHKSFLVALNYFYARVENLCT
jgi:nicotinamidase-related amidase